MKMATKWVWFGCLATVDSVERTVFIRGWQEQGDCRGLKLCWCMYFTVGHAIVLYTNSEVLVGGADQVTQP